MSHTKGPWHVMGPVDGGHHWIGSDDGTKYHRMRHLADVRLPDDMGADEMIDNARLISAAPELLEALEDCDRAFAGWQIGVPPGRPEDVLALITKVRAAIKKARGEW